MNSFLFIQCEDLLDPNIDKLVYPWLEPTTDKDDEMYIEMLLDI